MWMFAGYRVLPVLGAASAGLLAALAIVNDLNLYNDVRGYDLRDVSQTPSSARGSCVWQPTPQAVRDFLGETEEAARFRCLSNPRRFEALAMLSLHAARFALSGSGLDAATKTLVERHYYSVVKPAALGSTGTHHVRFDRLYEALTSLDFVNEPLPSCDAIYADVAAPKAPACATPPVFPTVICDVAGAPASHGADVPACAQTTSAQQMYSLCLQQFEYGRSAPNADALGLYDFTTPFEPELKLYEGELGFNASTTALQKSDIWVGLRFGLYLFYLVPACLLNGLLLVDAVLVAFWESTVRLRYRSIAARSSMDLKTARLMNQYVTANSFRRKRLRLAGFHWVLVVALTVTFQSLAFGFNGLQFPRPTCQTGSDEGWTSDFDNVWTTYSSLMLSLGAIVAHPVGLFLHDSFAMRREETAVAWGSGGRVERGAQTAGSWVTRWAIGIALVLGIAVLVFDAICISAALGIEWALSITRPETTSYPTLKYENLLFEAGSSFSSIALANGAMVALLLGRHLFGGRGFLFVIIFALWTAAGLAILLPLVSVASVRYAFDRLADVFSQEDVDLSDGSEVHAGVRGWVGGTYSRHARHWVLYGGVGLVASGFVTVVLYWLYRLVRTGSFLGNESEGYVSAEMPPEMEEVEEEGQAAYAGAVAAAAGASREELRTLLVAPAALVCADCDVEGDAAAEAGVRHAGRRVGAAALPPLAQLTSAAPPDDPRGAAAICAH